MERSSSQLYVGMDGWDGWDGMVIIGRRWSKSTFGANKFVSESVADMRRL